jgi:FAD/FMN-containing dehydrogenase
MSDAVPVNHGRQPTELLRLLAAASGDPNVISARDLRASFETAWTSRYRGECVTVALATATSEVAGVLRLCGDRQQPVVVQGGNTGLVGANVPRGGVPWGENRVVVVGPLPGTEVVAADSSHVRVQRLGS